MRIPLARTRLKIHTKTKRELRVNMGGEVKTGQCSHNHASEGVVAAGRDQENVA